MTEENQINWRKDFALDIEKRWEAKGQDGKKYWYVDGYASDVSIDRDGDRMSSKAIQIMKNSVEGGMNLYTDHEHGLFDMLGVLCKAEDRNGRLWVETRLEDPELNPKTKLFLHKLDIGEKIGLSIGGDMKAHHYEEDKRLGKRVRVIDDVVLYEISAVGIPSNAGAYLLGSVYKSHALKDAFAGRPGGAMGHQEEHSRGPGLCDGTHCEEIHEGVPHDEYVVKAKAETVENTTLKTNKQNAMEMTKQSIIERVVKDAIRSYGELTQDMGGELPAAASSPAEGKKPKEMPAYPDLDTSVEPEKSVSKMKAEEHDALGGAKIAVPDAGTVPKKLEDKPGEKPSGSHPDVAPAGKPGESVSIVADSGVGTGSSDKGSYSQTSDKDEEDEAKFKFEEAKKAFEAVVEKKKREAAKRDSKRDGDEFLARIQEGKKAEDEARAWLARKDEARAKLEEALGVPPVPAVPAMSEENDEEEEALKALIFTYTRKFFGTMPANASFEKEFESVIHSVFQPKGGAENLTNLRSPGQPEAKIPAEPGKSGSSEVFRTDTGSKGGLEVLEDAKKNPPASLDTAKQEPVATYETPTKLTSGTGYQMELLRSGNASTFKGKIEGRTTDHPSYTATKMAKSASELDMEKVQVDSLSRIGKPKLLPKLKQISPDRVPSEREIVELTKAGLLSEDLVAPEPADNKSSTVLMKGIKRVFPGR